MRMFAFLTAKRGGMTVAQHVQATSKRLAQAYSRVDCNYITKATRLA
jgi:hypothetical protein